jgi:hypothetical protein
MNKKIGMVVALVVGVVWVGGWLGQHCILAEEPAQEEVVTEEAGAASIFLTPPKPELEQEISEIMGNISKEHPISKEQSEELIQRMLTYSQSGSMGQEAMREFVRGLGIAAIPTIVGQMVDKDPDVRFKALLSLRYLMERGESIEKKKNYAEMEPALLVCFLRSLHDVEPKIRGACAGGLYRVAARRWPDPPPRAVSAIVVSAVEDPDESVRVSALQGLKLLGVPIKHPRLPESLWLN